MLRCKRRKKQPASRYNREEKKWRAAISSEEFYSVVNEGRATGSIRTVEKVKQSFTH